MREWREDLHHVALRIRARLNEYELDLLRQRSLSVREGGFAFKLGHHGVGVVFIQKPIIIDMGLWPRPLRTYELFTLSSNPFSGVAQRCRARFQ
jgi:hypothetical protein